jgi:hypothetical protein
MIVLCTPIYTNVTPQFLSSVLQLQLLFINKNIPFQYIFLSNDSLIPRARNKLCKYFLDIPNATYLLFIDSDIEFNPNDIIRLYLANKDIIGIAYAFKKLYNDKTIGVYNLLENSTPSNTGCTVSNRDSRVSQQANCTNDDKEINEAFEIGTGIMLIKRFVFLKMIESNPDDYILLDNPEDVGKSINERKYYRFFDTLINNNRYLSEDYMFCQKWRNLNGKIYLLKNTMTIHHGTFGYLLKN